MGIPKKIGDYIDWRFRRHNGPPIRLHLNDIQHDAYFDLKKHTKFTKAQFHKEMRASLHSRVISGFLTKEGMYYTGDHYIEGDK